MAEGVDNFMLVFTSEVSGQRRAVAQRVDAAGNALDLEPVVLDSSPGLGSPRVAWNGSLFLVVWSDAGFIYGSRILPDGTLLDPAPIVIMEGSSPDAAALGDVFLVVGTQPTISNHFVHPFGIRMQGSTGEILDSEAIWLGQYFARFPRVERFGNRWIASWQRNVSHDNPTAYIKYVFVEPNGTPTTEFQVTVGGQPEIACSDDQALLVWKTGTDSSSNPNIMATRLLPDGTQLDGSGFSVCSLADIQFHPDVVWTGTEYLVAWDDMRNAVVFFDERTDVYAARVNTDGIVEDPAGFPLSDTETPSERPVFARLGDRILFAASLFQSEFPYAAYRIGVRATASQIETTTVDELNVIRGIHVGGNLADVNESDDFYLRFNPGMTLNAMEPPVWLEFTGTLSSDNPATLAVTLEAKANTAGLSQTIDMFNYNTGTYEEVNRGSLPSQILSLKLKPRVTLHVSSKQEPVKSKCDWPGKLRVRFCSIPGPSALIRSCGR